MIKFDHNKDNIFDACKISRTQSYYLISLALSIEEKYKSASKIIQAIYSLRDLNEVEKILVSYIILPPVYRLIGDNLDES